MIFGVSKFYSILSSDFNNIVEQVKVLKVVFNEQFQDIGSLFAVTNTPELLDTSRWLYHSGVAKTEKCGLLLSGFSLHFSGNGVRMLVTTDLDLSVARYAEWVSPSTAKHL